jgi:hypothetical protein
MYLLTRREPGNTPRRGRATRGDASEPVWIRLCNLPPQAGPLDLCRGPLLPYQSDIKKIGMNYSQQSADVLLANLATAMAAKRELHRTKIADHVVNLLVLTGEPNYRQ